MTNIQSNRDDATKIAGLNPASPAPAQQTQGGGDNTNQPKPAEKPQQK